MRSGTTIGRRLVWGLDIVWTAIVFFIVLTPFLASIDSPVAKFLYIAFRPTCHQLSSRCFFIWGHKMAVCSRCTGIWFSSMLAGYIATILLYFNRIKGIKLKWFIIALIPLVLDGGSQVIGLRESNNILRLITGIIAGIATVWMTYPSIWVAGDK